MREGQGMVLLLVPTILVAGVLLLVEVERRGGALDLRQRRMAQIEHTVDTPVAPPARSADHRRLFEKEVCHLAGTSVEAARAAKPFERRQSTGQAQSLRTGWHAEGMPQATARRWREPAGRAHEAEVAMAPGGRCLRAARRAFTISQKQPPGANASPSR